MTDIAFYHNQYDRQIAYCLRRHNQSGVMPAQPAVIFLSGYRSDMNGTKASFIDVLSSNCTFDYLRFDYSGHGQSSGDFIDLTLSDWINDAHSIIEHLFGNQRELILVGSSMGGWIGLKLLSRLKNTIPHWIGLAPAPDFTKKLMASKRKGANFQLQLSQKGYAQESCDYEGEDFIITQKFLEDGDLNSVLDNPISFQGKAHILQGMCDQDVPFEHAFDICQALQTEHVTIQLLKSADHRLSTPEALEKLQDIILSCLKSEA